MWFQGTDRTTGRHEKQIGELQDAVTELERSMRNLQLDADAMFDKTHRLFGRIAKRAAIDNPMPPSELEPAAPAVVGSDEISQKILARRAMGRKK